MSAKTEIVCDQCGADLTYTDNSAGYRVVLASQPKTSHPDTVAVTDWYEADPLPESKHFCDTNCLASWVVETLQPSAR